jgi:curli production assembly/transport component CsgG
MLGTIVRTMGAAGLVLLSGCGGSKLAYKFTERATAGYTTAIHGDLVSLPPPLEKIVIAVYKFRDQTGQYKTSAQATTFSTAVTQGATSMLIKALDDSGWFTVIEREALPNLLNERQIIRSTRAQYAAEGGPQLGSVPPLLYAGVLLEGGIIGYDTNLITGGAGVAYLGFSGSGQVRCDQITLYLRLVSTQNGQVLKSMSVSKTVLSREVDFGIYRFVRTNTLLEAETGLSTNEPPTMCALEAIEKGIYDLILDGILDNLWALKDPNDMNAPALQDRLKERQETARLATLDPKGRPARNARAKANTKPAPPAKATAARKLGSQAAVPPRTRRDAEPEPQEARAPLPEEPGRLPPQETANLQTMRLRPPEPSEPARAQAPPLPESGPALAQEVPEPAVEEPQPSLPGQTPAQESAGEDVAVSEAIARLEPDSTEGLHREESAGDRNSEWQESFLAEMAQTPLELVPMPEPAAMALLVSQVTFEPGFRPDGRQPQERPERQSDGSGKPALSGSHLSTAGILAYGSGPVGIILAAVVLLYRHWTREEVSYLLT